MPRGLGYFFLAVTFIIGVSVGLYTGAGVNEENEINNDTEIAQSIQDVVIKRVQSGDLWKENTSSGENDSGNTLGEDEKNMVEVVVSEEKISPYAKMIITKTFTRCNHSSVTITDVPKEIINFERGELEEKYSGWVIEEFSANQIVLSREIDANCSDHYVIKEKDGNLAVYNELTEDKMNLVEVIEIDTELLGEEDRNNLKDGIRVYGKNELSSLIEDYNS